MNSTQFNSPENKSTNSLDSASIDSLTELALNLQWSWNHSSDALWQELDPQLWELTRNPWIVLQTVSHDQLKQKLSDTSFREKINDLIKIKEFQATDPTWFAQQHSTTSLTTVAYFSMEFMLTEALPIYVGGLGNVAGDQLKSASDLGVPVVAIGLLYQQGYFRQEIDKNGWQQALFPYNDPGQLPITPLRLPNGEWLRIQVTLPGYAIWLRTWQVQVGRVKLYLLDSNDMANLPIHRGITSELYGGESDLRIKQEMVLGMGGWRLLKALGISPEVCHMNEGHAAFLILERARDFMDENGISFSEALAVTRSGNLFTTHTAVAAGFDHFSTSLMEEFLGEYAKNKLHISMSDLMALGRLNPNDQYESFNMAYLAIRGSGAVNGVSRLHGTVSRHLFESLFPRWPNEEVSIGYITNGVHMPTWDSLAADELWTTACGKDRWRGNLENLALDISHLSDEDLWQLRSTGRANLVNYTRKRLERQFHASGQSQEVINKAKDVFDPAVLTLGFARRFVSYKRPNLLLHDPERFIRILTNPEQPVQLIIAGKAPPFDDYGKSLIQQWVQFIQQHNLYKHVVFISDYDMLVTEHMVEGADVWVNTPRRPWEACGTSGMKVLVNGGLNVSELDGWWAEAYTPEVGWALGDQLEQGDNPAWDAAEAITLYELLENQIIPEFYHRNQQGKPLRWIERMRKSMSLLTPTFSSNRSVREYTEHYYLPAAKKYQERTLDKGSAGKRIVAVKKLLASKWNEITFRKAQTAVIENGYHFQIQVDLNGINPEEVSVELYAEGIGSDSSEKIIMMHDPNTNGSEFTYTGTVITKRPSEDYTTRIIPRYENIAVPLEDNLIRWQH